MIFELLYGASTFHWQFITHESYVLDQAEGVPSVAQCRTCPCCKGHHTRERSRKAHIWRFTTYRPSFSAVSAELCSVVDSSTRLRELPMLFATYTCS